MTLLLALAIAACPDHGKRYTCVVDGDTVWLEREKMRIAEIDTPELNGRCQYERVKARGARTRLVQILNTSEVRFERIGKDRFGRTLVKMPEVSEQLIREGLARKWSGRRESWCND